MMNSFRNLRKIIQAVYMNFDLRDILFIIASNMFFLVPYPVSFLSPESNISAARLNGDV